MDSRKKVLIGCTGSVATIKLPLLCEKLWRQNLDIRVVVTEHAKHFLKDAELPPGTQILSDTVEWAAWQGRGDPVLHVDLAKWADLFLIAPLDANTLGKLANGICDNILTCVARAWDINKPLLFCPAMNTMMWEHPVTAPQVDRLKSWGYKEIGCITKTLMCGDTGIGAMAEVDTIVQATLRCLVPWGPYPSTDLRYIRSE
ncbi:phosphopantothenoylcysteine decarboxylase [Venturia canescens]|uniref:phosphopantothenoylcysteine decarboxylase n=1 Tax=Venturia canescens TaxID=32260 RepID=UPI001C9CE956|nr:phosphopantothenoylcysteine decarboxylase [Venturia canescens]